MVYQLHVVEIYVTTRKHPLPPLPPPPFTNPTQVDKDGATTALIILFCTVLVFVGSLMLSRWTMNKTLSYTLLGTYVVYVIYTITAEALS